MQLAWGASVTSHRSRPQQTVRGRRGNAVVGAEQMGVPEQHVHIHSPCPMLHRSTQSMHVRSCARASSASRARPTSIAPAYHTWIAVC